MGSLISSVASTLQPRDILDRLLVSHDDVLSVDIHKILRIGFLFVDSIQGSKEIIILNALE
jgi:hypothetical protein